MERIFIWLFVIVLLPPFHALLVVSGFHRSKTHDIDRYFPAFRPERLKVLGEYTAVWYSIAWVCFTPTGLLMVARYWYDIIRELIWASGPLTLR